MKVTKGRAALAVLGTAVLVAATPAVASAATVTITDDSGQPVPLNAAAPPTLRNMDIRTSTSKSAGNGSFSMQAFDPAGAAIGSWDTGDCWTINDVTNNLPYHGNGAYRLVVNSYASTNCTGAASAATYAYSLASSVAIAAPAGPVLIRAKNSFSAIQQQLGFTGNPGGSYEIKYSANGVLGPDGGFSGPSSSAFVNSTTGTVNLSLSDPGTYTVIGRATSDGYSTPWSAPATVVAQAPFDIRSTSYPDSRGPRYTLRATVGEDSARGRVSVFLGKGKRGKYRRIGRAKVTSQGTVTLKFTHRGTGSYRIKYSFKGSATTQKGSVVEKVRFTRRVVG